MSVFTHSTASNNYGPAKWIVDSAVGNGTHTTIAAALTSSSSGDTIFIRPGTYTENLTLKAGVNLTAFDCDASLRATGHVIISGTCTMTTAGTVSISGIQLQTNSAALLAVTGSAASIVELFNCFLNMTNNSGITFSSSSASAAINISSSRGNLGTTGIAAFAHSSAGQLVFNNTFLFNNGGSTTASTCSAGTLTNLYSQFLFPITTSGTSQFQSSHSVYTNAQNVTNLTCGGSVFNSSGYDAYNSGTASCISVGSNLTLIVAALNSTNTNAITGAGTVNYSNPQFQNSAKAINTTTQTDLNSGSWTPTIQFGGASVGITYSSNTGNYVRIGSLIVAEYNIVLTSKGSSTGGAVLAGLPFTSSATTQSGGQCVVNHINLTLTAGNYTAFIATVASAGGFAIAQSAIGSTSQLIDTNFANNTIITGWIFYFA